MTWDVDATDGLPVTARGTCTGTCHSDGQGGSPRVTPYWAGGNWDSGSCDNCHQATPDTNKHDKHVNGESMACVDCHPDPGSSSHLNGIQDVRTTISGSITVTMNDCEGETLPTCNGTCHNKNHPNKCWK
jgi:hypothetical protein